MSWTTMTVFLITWGIAAFFQGLFWGVLTRRLVRYPMEDAPLPAVALPPVSVIVCARNEAANLQKKLHTLLQQDYPKWELVVVDDASTDTTPDILAKAQAQYPHLRIVQLAEKTQHGKKGALAAGIAAARYEHLLLTDADCVPTSPRWIQHMASCAVRADATLVLGTGPYEWVPTVLGRWVVFETTYVAIQYLTAALWGQPYMGVGRNLWYTQSAFQKAGGFEAHAHLASGDDDLLVNAIATGANTTICLHPESAVYSSSPKTWKGLYRQKTRHYSSSTTYHWHHQMGLGILSLSLVLFYLGMPVLMVQNSWNLVILGTVGAVRAYAQYRTYRTILRHWKQRQLLPYIVLLDLLLPFYYGLFALAVFRPQQRPQWERSHE